MTRDDVSLRHGRGVADVPRCLRGTADLPVGSLPAFLNLLFLFPPDDTASNLDPADPTKPNFPQFGHGSSQRTVLFSDSTDTRSERRKIAKPLPSQKGGGSELLP